ncbi:MAG: acetyl CoA synthetase subunit alpha [Chlamydiae bacterium CG10_big_fil_rev_8_21_14_0_10_42_34]|nr:MAG: acetyl CoA synthetase subunit alpha [Chlamydiae bacterium CG10_big_fil_rev_8_21_14_0_10_42_34]
MSHPESFDPSMNILYRKSLQLDKIFKPKMIAVVGATDSEGSVGRTVMHNLLSTPFGGKAIPINPKREFVLGEKAYPNLKSVPEKIDLVVVVTPAKIVPQIISECADLNIPTAVIISAGFKEMGPPGIALEKQILEHARRGKMRVIGPNCLGVMNPNTGLNATFAAGIAQKGSLAFISQSGALCTAVLDWSLREKVGFSAFVSIGSMIDVNWGDLINYFGSDPGTSSILIYMESIGDARSFLSAAREVSLNKPIILIKAGRSAESAKAAASHTGSLAGSDDALSAALRRVGVLRVNTIADLFSMAETLAKQPRPRGPRLTIVTNAGGPGVIATDALIKGGAQLAPIPEDTMEALNALLPAPWSHNNPVDILGDANAEIYAKTVEIVSKNPDSDGILVILTPQDMTDSTGTAEKLRPYAHLEKPIIASWMGADTVKAGGDVLTNLGIPNFEYPDLACKTFASMWNYTYNLRGIYEVPLPSVDLEPAMIAKRAALEEIFAKALKEKRTILDEVESKQVLEAYDIPCTPTRGAKTSDEAIRLANEIGYPVVLKLYSHTITHKSDVGGVKLNLHNESEVKEAFDEIRAAVSEKDCLGVTVQPMIKLSGYELILGSTVDVEFGPVILFGSGGQLVEVYKDRALAIPPLTTTLAKRLMEQTKIYHALHGVRGKKAVDMTKLEQILVRFSELVVDQPWIKECDINPLLADEGHLIAVDARVILHDPDTKKEDLPTLAIRPYPIQYIETFQLKNKQTATLRPIRPEDEPLIIKFHKDLSLETVRQRYLKAVNYEERVAHERLVRICFNDYDREIALVVEANQEILGVIRLTKIAGSRDATFALIVKDQWQNMGIGTKLMEKILEVSKKENIERVYSQMLEENFQMKKLCEHFGFQLKTEGKLIYAVKDHD